ncbi:MAG: thioredoxin domain-containing protein [Pseudomonadota bacterium]|nr:thioredoxin domain-containing protein [Pseudomonadota bacterium]
MKLRVLVIALAVAFAPALAATAAPKPEQTVDMAEVLKPGPLPELSFGPDNGVAIVEYGSVTCPHCAVFDHEIWPKVKAAYVDTGKVRYIFREFSRNPLDVAAFTLARCVGDDKDKTMATIELLFATQEKWAFTDNPLEPLLAALRPTGLGRDKAMACLKDNALIGKVRAITDTAEKVVKVQGTPTFVIDGKSYGGELSLADFDELLKPLVK